MHPYESMECLVRNQLSRTERITQTELDHSRTNLECLYESLYAHTRLAVGWGHASEVQSENLWKYLVQMNDKPEKNTNKNIACSGTISYCLYGYEPKYE